MSRGSGRWPVLTRSLEDAANPVRIEVDKLLDKSAVRAVRASYRAEMGTFKVHASGANAGTIGTAFDTAMRLLIDPHPNLGDALSGAANVGQPAFIAFRALIEVLGASATPRGDRVPGGDPIDSPLQVRRRDSDLLVRACWPLALATEVYRSGAHPASPLIEYLSRTARPTGEGLLSLTSDRTAAEISALVELAQDNLLAPLATKAAPWFLGPIFTASQWMKADADLIAGDMLVEIKTHLGDNKAGARVPDLSLATLRQMIGYVLHDVDDRYRLDRLGIYEARYGTLIAWPLQQFLDKLAGRAVDLAEQREQHAQILTQT